MSDMTASAFDAIDLDTTELSVSDLLTLAGYGHEKTGEYATHRVFRLDTGATVGCLTSYKALQFLIRLKADRSEQRSA